MLSYKGYICEISIDFDANFIRGKVINTQDVITFYGKTVKEAQKAFQDSVDDYLDFCKGSPEKPYSGKIFLRLTPELHRNISILAKKKKISVNQLIINYLEKITKPLT